MSRDVFTELGHFVATVLGTAAALVVFVILRALLKKIGSRVPVEWCELLDRVLGSSRGHTDPQSSPTVNVEYHDAGGGTMDLGPFVKARLRNSRAGSFELYDGTFLNCDPAWIKVGASVEISVQDGLVRERLRVQIDVRRQVLFVRSPLALSELFDRINQGAPDSTAALSDVSHGTSASVDSTPTDSAPVNEV